MSYVLQTKDEIDERILALFQAAGFSNAESAGSPEHALYKILTEEVSEAYSTLNSAYQGALPLDASGANLDLWSTFLGTKRQLATYAKDDTETNVYFYFPQDYDLSVLTEDVVISAGTLISSNGVSKFYETTQDVTLNTYSASEKIKYVRVRAQDSGENNNVNSEELNTHNLTVDGLLVSNKFPIQSGVFPQTDLDLKTSMQNIFGKLLNTNLASIQFAIISLPGVANVSMFPLIRGTGTFSVFIDSTAPVVSLQLINQVQEAVDQQKALGTVGYVSYPDYKSITIKFEIMPQEGINVNDIISALEATESQLIVDSINNIPRGSSFDPNTVLRIVLDNSKVLNAKVKELKIGIYSVIDQTVKENETVAALPRHLKITEKWFSAIDLCTYCGVSFE
jgi:hypothetical protein